MHITVAGMMMMVGGVVVQYVMDADGRMDGTVGLQIPRCSKALHTMLPSPPTQE